jgi:glucosamine--fructose-6-phosphate aminotransferase (isomerizing)
MSSSSSSSSSSSLATDSPAPGSSYLAQEIASQPDEVERFIERHLPQMRRMADALPACSYALVAARGSSDHAATYARYVWGALAGLPVAPAAPSLHTLYKTPPRMAGALVVGISQSGQSPDVVSVVEEGRKQGRPTIAFTNDETSPLAQHADFVFKLCETPEHAIAATKTYTTQLTGVALLGATLGRSEAHIEELRRLPAAMRQVLAGAREGAQLAGSAMTDVTSFLTIARGINLCTADELGLKLRELLCLPTHGWSAADFRHGSIAMIVRGTPVLLVMPSGVGFDDLQKLAVEVTDRGAAITVISDDPAAAPMARNRVPLAVAVSEWLSPLTTVLAGQLLALEMVKARGLNPDRPAGLGAKVVKTV